MPLSSRKTSFLIILGCVIIVCLPLLGGLKREIARWHLAAAANAIEFGNGDYQESLQKAAESGIDLKTMHDFWMVQIDKKAADNPFDLQVVLDEATKRGFDESALSRRALQQWFEAQRAAKRSQIAGEESLPRMLSNIGELLQLRLQESSMTPEQKDDVENRNLLAYNRALAGVELDKALKDINFALDHYPNMYHFLDTRAWIYYRLNQFDKALEDANASLESLERYKVEEPGFWESVERAVFNWVASTSSTSGSATQDGSGANSTTGGSVAEGSTEATDTVNKESTPVSAVEQGILNVEAVLRSHRAMILEALGKTDDAQVDWDWLSERDFPTDGSLR